jgi:hypothetical protein
MAAELTTIHTIPVYKGLSPMESWAKIVLADGEPITGPRGGKRPAIDGWANIGEWENSEGDRLLAPMAEDEYGEPIGVI